jgi:cytochrome c556|tara:strand:- start:311 stop:763 length:453 start_codon:yes stop_codon:yes gene_type:complete
MSKFFQLLVVIIFLASSINIFAIEMSTEETIKARKAMFKQNYSYAKKMSAAIKKDDKETISDLAIKMSENYKKLIDYFPDDSKDGFKTEALPSIWEKKEEFNALMMKAANEANDFSMMVNNLMGDELKDLQKKMIWSQCKSCHDKFRMPH